MFYRSLTKSIKNKLQTAQNKMIRYILGYGSRHHLTVNDFKKVKMLDVQSRVNYLTLNMMHNVFYGLAPEYLCTFTKISEIHDHETRNSMLGYHIPHTNSHGKSSFMYNGAKLWNDLPISIKTVESKELFKFSSKKHQFKIMSLLESSEYIYF